MLVVSPETLKQIAALVGWIIPVAKMHYITACTCVEVGRDCCQWPRRASFVV